MTSYRLNLTPPVVISAPMNAQPKIIFRFTCDHGLDTITGSLCISEGTEENEGRAMLERLLRLRGDPPDQLKHYPVGRVCGWFIPHLKDSEIDSEFNLVVPSKLFAEIRADARVGKFPSSARIFADDGRTALQDVDHHLMLRTNQADAPIFVMHSVDFYTTLAEPRAENESRRASSEARMPTKTINLDEGATHLLKGIRSYLLTIVVLALIHIIHHW